MSVIRVTNGPGKGAAFPISTDTLVIGRDPGCDIQLLDKGASRRHAEIFPVGEMVFVRDLGSRNGTFVNDAQVTEELLRSGDQITIGATVLLFDSGQDRGKVRQGDDDSLEFSEESFGNTLELRLEDLSAVNVTDSDGSEARKLRAIYRLGRLLAEKLTEDTLISEALPFIAEELRASCAYLFIRDDLRGAIFPLGVYHHDQRARGGKVSRTIIRRAIQEKRALLTSDAMQDNRFSSHESIVIKQIRSVICVPLSVSGDVSGVLYLAGDSALSIFDEEDLELAAAMAGQVGLAIANLRIREMLRRHLVSTVRMIARTAETTVGDTPGHAETLASRCLIIAQHLGVGVQDQDSIVLAALLHDVGVLATHSRSTESYDEVEKTLDLIRDMTCFPMVEDGIRCQLEREDGSGPLGLSGTEIPMPARIIAAAHEFTKLLDNPAIANEQEKRLSAVQKIENLSGTLLDAACVDACIAAHEDGSFYLSLDDILGPMPGQNKAIVGDDEFTK